MFPQSKLISIRSFFSMGAIAAAIFSQSPAHAACDMLRVEASIGNTTYYGSAIPLTVNGKSVLITADHILPFEVQAGDTVSVFTSSQNAVEASVIRRDWASDLMILEPSSGIGSNCNLTSKGANAGDLVSLAGYPAGSSSKVTRTGTVLEAASPAVRVARPIPLIKATGFGEKGMSGGALINRDGSIAGILLQDWINPNHPEQTGVYALPAAQLSLQVSAMLAQSELEMPAPFQIRRAVPEMSAYGFRFRPTRGDSISERQMGGVLNSKSKSGGGHPDGIGGESSGERLEVVGLSGDPIAAEWLAMAKILRRIQSEGGSEMLVAQTASGESCGNLVELGRILLASSASPPDLNFFLNSTSSSSTTSGSQDDLDTLSERVVILALSLAEKSPSAVEPAQQIRGLQADWVRTHEVRKLQQMTAIVQASSQSWSAAAEADSNNWKSVIELQVLVLRINKALGKSTS